MTDLTDAHTHRPLPDGVTGVRSLFQPEEFSMPVLPDLFSAGLHPMDAAKPDRFPPESLLAHPNCAAIGETGLDRRYPVPLPQQMTMFRRQAELAEELKKPLIVHAVRTHQEVLKFKKEFQPQASWILHGFRGTERKAMELLEAGFILSFGEGLLRDAGTLELYFRKIPLDRILLETDDSGADLRQINAEASAMYEMDAVSFAKTVKDHFSRIFLRKRS